MGKWMNTGSARKGMMMISKASPDRFDPSQEMTRKTLELRYQLDAETPRVEFHAHPFYEIYYFLEGPMRCYVVGGRSYSLCSGDVLMIPPGVPHHPIFTPEAKPYRRYVLWLTAEHLEQMEHLDPGVTEVLRICQRQETYRIYNANPAASQTLESCLNTMWQEEKNGFPCKDACLYSLCLHFLVQLNRMIVDDHVLTPKPCHSDSLLDRVLAYIHEHYAEAISLRSVAEHFFTSQSNIESLMTKKLGKPFYCYVTECRIIHAETLIASGMPLKEVGIACGYNDYSNFYRAFSRKVGISPSRFRQCVSTDHFQATPIAEWPDRGIKQA